MTKYDDYSREVANTIIDAINNGCGQWLRGWDTDSTGSPVNAISRNRYRGINETLLFIAMIANNYRDNRWVTYKQAQSLGGSVKKGEKGIKCMFWNPISPDKIADQNDIDDDCPLHRFIAKTFVVFNVEQCTDLELEPIDDNKKTYAWCANDVAEQIIANSNALIEYDDRSTPCYVISSDKIIVPHKDRFHSASEYYDTVLHELAHWTGHNSRLNRSIDNRNNRQQYAREELRAELASMMIASMIGLPHNVNQHAAYIDSWVDILNDDPKEIFRASSAASKIADYLINIGKVDKIINND